MTNKKDLDSQKRSEVCDGNGLLLNNLSCSDKCAELFHKAWSIRVGTPGYNKKAWVDAQSILFNANQQISA